MSDKYTAIYRESWLAGSHMHALVRIKRMERKEEETVRD